MIRFNNDYNHGAHPAILKALEETNGESYGGYGLDEWCAKASDEIKKYLDNPSAVVHFLIGGTQTNVIGLEAMLRPYQGVISAESGHIHVHETGALENTGHKILALPAENGKISAAQIKEVAEDFKVSGVKEHIVEPKCVYISFPTEFGTIYSKKELTEIYEVCQEYGLYLFVDGARMGYGLGADENDVTLPDLAKMADMFYLGGTKCGALFGEALVITKKELQTSFRSYMKQNGAMLAKGWLLGLQFYTLFKDGLYFDITKKADKLAMVMKKAFAQKGIPAYIDSPTNQQFVVVTNEQMEQLGKEFVFEYENKVDEEHSCIRFCTSWSTTEEEVDALVQAIGKLN